MRDTSRTFPSALEAIIQRRIREPLPRREPNAEHEQDGPIVKLVNRMIEDAHAHAASEIHIDPRPNATAVLHLHEGVATERMRLPRRTHPNVVNRLKIMAGLSPISGQARGRITFRRFSREGLDVNIAVEFLPLPSGERAALRFLPSAPETEGSCGYSALVLLLLEEAHAQGVRELRWEPGGRHPRVLRIRGGHLEERLALPQDAYPEHLRILRTLADLSPNRDRGSFDLTALSPQQLEVRVVVEQQPTPAGTRLVLTLEPFPCT